MWFLGTGIEEYNNYIVEKSLFAFITHISFKFMIWNIPEGKRIFRHTDFSQDFYESASISSVLVSFQGLVLTFFSGVYGTCIGAVNRFGSEEKSLIGLSGIFIGVGEILGESKFAAFWQQKGLGWWSNSKCFGFFFLCLAQ